MRSHATTSKSRPHAAAERSAADADAADLLGDWSPVRTEGILAAVLDRTRSARLPLRPFQAARRNEAANLRLVHRILESASGRVETRQ